MGPPADPAADPNVFSYLSSILKGVTYVFIAIALIVGLFAVKLIVESVFRHCRPSVFETSGVEARGEEQPDPQSAPSTSYKAEVQQASNYSGAVSVLMPGEDYLTHFAVPSPAPLRPDRVEWPSHAESSQKTVSWK